MSKLLDLTRYAKNNPVSLAFIIPEDMPVNRETRRGGWLTCAGYPTETAAGWEWRFVQ